jgi:transcriptional regulator with PAS, ATPase and Fis domain
LQEGEIDRVGGTSTIIVDIRIIAASNKDLEAAVSDNTFREDLYYRLSVFPIDLPPLRERKDDIPALVEHFISKFSVEMNTPLKNIDRDAIDTLTAYSWKGNIRELENVIERAMILCEDELITGKHLRLAPSAGGSLDDIGGGTLEEAAKAALRIVETRCIKRALEETHGNKTRAAELLKVSYKTLLTKIKDYGI